MNQAIDIDVLAQPLELPCGVVLSNRFANAAMSEQMGDRYQAPTPELATLYERWARGGSGLVITGNVMVDRRAMGEPLNVVLEDDRHREAFEAWASAGNVNGSAIWMQVNHPGRQSPRHLSAQPVAPSAIGVKVARGAFATPRALTDTEVHEIVARFATAARIARETGFGGVQVHGAHGYLVSQFLSPRTNLRDDAWGGTPEKRMRFLLEVVRAMRSEVGSDFPIGVKLNSADFQRGGFTEAESMDVVRALEHEGVDLLEVSGGTYESAAMMGKPGRSASAPRESTRQREAYFLDYAATVREITSMPLMLTGGFRTAGAMAQAVGEGIVDVVGLARPLAVDPDLPNRLLSGEVDASDSAPLSVGVKRLDSVLEISWHTHQLHRMGRSKEPNPDHGNWRSLATTVMRDGINTFRRRRS